MDRLERLTNLVLVLLREGRARSLAEIADEVPGYPPPGEARRQAFERDKRTLRDQGIEVSTEPLPGREQVGYRIRPEDFYLPELDLEPDEQVALNLAVAAVHVGDGSGQQALWRLGLPTGPGPAALAELPTVPALPVLFEAIRARSAVRFAYRDRQRTVAPAQLRFQRGRWYLAGWDVDREAWRTFRVDRMAGVPRAGAAGSGPLPDGPGPGDLWAGEPWRAGDEVPSAVDVLVDAVVAPRVVRDVGEPAVVDRRPGGAAVVRLEVTNHAALRAWVLEMGQHAEVLAPAEARADVVRWLRAVAGDDNAPAGGVPRPGGGGDLAGAGTGGDLPGAGASGDLAGAGTGGGVPEEAGVPGPPVNGAERPGSGTRPAGASRGSAGTGPDERPGAGGSAGTGPDTRPGTGGSAGTGSEADHRRADRAARQTGRDAGARLRRLLAVLAVLARERSVALAELAEQFAMSPAEVAADLELAACCGLPPYTPDQLMEIVVDDHEVVARLEPALARPRRLTPAEGLALAAAARAILAVPGADPAGALRRAADKLDAVLVGRDGLRIDLDEPEHLAVVRRAVEAGEQLAIRYHSASRDEVVDRVVDPFGLALLDGRWYLDGWCHHAGGLRRFRVDRVLQAEATGRPAEVGAHGDGPAGAGGGERRGGAPSGAAGDGRGMAGGAAPYVPSPDAVVARLLVEPEGAWLVDAVPTLGAEHLPDGRTAVDLPVSSAAWFGRLLVRLGPHATVLSPADLADAGAAAARRILCRYGD